MAMDDAQPDILPWKPYTEVIAMNEDELKAYYRTVRPVFPRPCRRPDLVSQMYHKGLTELQRTCIDNHTLGQLLSSLPRLHRTDDEGQTSNGHASAIRSSPRGTRSRSSPCSASSETPSTSSSPPSSPARPSP